MSFKHVSYVAGCIVAWFILLPLCALGTGLAMLSYALGTEIGDFFSGRGTDAVDGSAAREIAHRMIIGH